MAYSIVLRSADPYRRSNVCLVQVRALMTPQGLIMRSPGSISADLPGFHFVVLPFPLKQILSNFYCMLDERRAKGAK